MKNLTKQTLGPIALGAVLALITTPMHAYAQQGKINIVSCSPAGFKASTSNLSADEIGLAANTKQPQPFADDILVLNVGERAYWDPRSIGELQKECEEKNGKAIIIANCTPGQGASFETGNVKDNEMEILFPNVGAPPVDDVILVMTKGQQPFWDFRTRTEIDEACRKEEPPIPAAKGAAIQPLSGVWRGEVGDVRLQGCPPMVQQMATPMLAEVKGFSQAAQKIDMPEPFHPDWLPLTLQFEAQGHGEVKWEELGPNQWQAEILPRYFQQASAQAGAQSKLVWTISVLNQKHIAHKTVIHLGLPKAVTKLMGGDGACKGISESAWLYVGP